MRSEAGAKIRSMLAAGLIVSGKVQEGATAEALWHRDPMAIRLGSQFFVMRHAGDAAQVLGHELGHLKQQERRGLIYGESMSEAVWEWLTRSRGDAALGDAFFQMTQLDADRYGCSVAIGVVNMRIAGRCQ